MSSDLVDVDSESFVSKNKYGEQYNISQSSEDLQIVDSISDLSPNKPNNYQRIKPEHWTDSYWKTITTEYTWFIHKEENAGCRICHTGKSFVGKKSLMATMKLKFMDLSYEEFEKKLRDHQMSTQHEKAVTSYNELDKNSYDNELLNVSTDVPVTPNSSVTSVKRVYTVDFMCPLCSKGYKFKKGLATHIFNCKRQPDSRGFLSPCGCEGYLLYSIGEIDEHNIAAHSGKYLFNCKICVEQYKSATGLYEHLLLRHNYEWNPFVDMPMITVNSKQEYSNSRHERKKRMSNNDDIWYKDSDGSESNENDGVKSIKRKKMVQLGSVPHNKIEKIINDDKQEMSHLKLSLDQIHTCEYCGGRYLSGNILNEHIASRHPTALQSVAIDDDDDKLIYRKKLMANTESGNVSLPEEAEETQSEVNETTDKRTILKKNNSTPDNHVSACLLACPMCQISFANLDDRNEHVTKHHPEMQQFICQHCGLIFTNHTNYNRHMEKCHNYNALQKVHKNSSLITFSCNVCPLVFTNQADLSHHSNLSHPEENNSKEEIFGTEEMDKEKEKVEMEKETRQRDLDRLIMSLIGADATESVCPCPQCECVSHNAYELVIHSLTHHHQDNGTEAINLPSCPNCSRLFFGEFSKIYLKDHYNIEHLKKPAPQCILCKVVFPSSFVLDKHLSTGMCHPNGFDDPYHPLMADDKLAFSCAQCGMIFAGQTAKFRLDIHNETCTLELMDEDEFLDS